MDNDIVDILITPKHTDEYLKRFGLSKSLSGLHLWGIGVGTVIAGTFFGWNYGLEFSGSIGFFISTLIVTVFYILLIYIFSELSSLFPYAGGPYAYVRKGLGTFVGYLTGIFTIIEFLFAAAAVTVSIGSYISNIYPNIPKMYLAVGFYLLLLIIDIIGVKQSAIVQLVMTGIAISALVIFFIGTAGSVNLPHIFHQQSFVNGYIGIIKAMPFAFWFYLCIEGISLAAEETKNPKKDMLFGFRYSILTICILNLMVLVVCLSTVDINFLLSNDYPLSYVLSVALPDDKVAFLVFSTLALSSLFASLHGMINGYSRQIFALSRAGYLPRILSRIHPITKTPYLAIIIAGMIGIALAYNFDAKALVFTAGLAALFMYALVIYSYIKLKKNEYKKRNKQNHKWLMFLYFIDIILFALGLTAVINAGVFLYAMIFLAVIVLYYVFIGRRFIVNDAPEEIEARAEKIIIK